MPTASLSAIADEAGFENFALVSDIEGAEVGFIRHDAAALARCRQLIIELHDVHHGGRDWTGDELTQAIRDHGFEPRGRSGKVGWFER